MRIKIIYSIYNFKICNKIKNKYKYIIYVKKNNKLLNTLIVKVEKKKIKLNIIYKYIHNII